MSFLASLFGRKAPTSDAISRELARLNVETPRLAAELEAAQSAFANIATMSDSDLEAAEHARTMARRRIERHQAQIAELQEALSSATKAEAMAALKARSDAVRRAVEVDAPKALDTYDDGARKVAEGLQRFAAIRAEVEVLNQELAAARLPLIDSPDDLYRKEPDVIVPEVREKRTKWVRYNRATGQEEDVGITVTVAGQQLPSNGYGASPDARRVEYEHVTPGKTKYGRRLDSLSSVSLPPARVGAKRHWPREA
ncbi:MAG TPA: hypothetical protein VGU24_08365 [Microvirga sp.]|jgi:uncharacterized phage infection (PIP) family protein YhgE|nr:hypothetical protein [Microvirga sp.]